MEVVLLSYYLWFIKYSLKLVYFIVFYVIIIFKALAAVIMSERKKVVPCIPHKFHTANPLIRSELANSLRISNMHYL
jgi:hypothetical protein